MRRQWIELTCVAHGSSRLGRVLCPVSFVCAGVAGILIILPPPSWRVVVRPLRPRPMHPKLYPPDHASIFYFGVADEMRIPTRGNYVQALCDRWTCLYPRGQKKKTNNQVSTLRRWIPAVRVSPFVLELVLPAFFFFFDAFAHFAYLRFGSRFVGGEICLCFGFGLEFGVRCLAFGVFLARRRFGDPYFSRHALFDCDSASDPASRSAYGMIDTIRMCVYLGDLERWGCILGSFI
ncbi:hypothetical protein BJ138DRAFT_558875 [Hygrophoropsis aurantiaca]|uniref:Uncharacterized protein n=1 Tax=Hygrophoropsis aurantiaca TaxID=72124 RepID=A0ACB8A1D4_9AGAM|nr:hypothetical protein BJ138DRAFT_558875 [Hygrophoropsis aurantiaca]